VVQYVRSSSSETCSAWVQFTLTYELTYGEVQAHLETDFVVDERIFTGLRCALNGGVAAEVELVVDGTGDGVFTRSQCVYYQARTDVHEATPALLIYKSRVMSLLTNDDGDLNVVLGVAHALYGFFNTSHFVLQNSIELSVGNSVSIHDNSGGDVSILLLESLQQTLHGIRESLHSSFKKAYTYLRDR
jgi:hypothetical protein